MLHGFKELSKEKPKNDQMCFCLVRNKSFMCEDCFYTKLAKYSSHSDIFYERDEDGFLDRLHNVELWLPCDIDVDGILCDEMYEIEESDLKPNRYMSKRTQPQ